MGRTKQGRFVGIDVGKRTYALAIKEEGKDFVMSNGRTSPEGRLALYKKLRPEDTVGLEAGNMAFIIAIELVKVVGCTVYVLNARKLKVICESAKKTDKEDAKKLSWCVQRFPADELPLVPVPSEEEMKRRKLLNSYARTKRHRTRLINQLHGQFVSQGITTVVKKDLATVENRREMVKMLSGLEAEEAGWLLEQIGNCEERITRLKALMDNDAKGDERIARLKKIPGVGPLTAFAYVAYVNEGRFDSGHQVSNFLGLTPWVYMSGDTNRTGRITKRGNNYLRGLLVEASWSLIRSKQGGALKERYEYMTNEKGLGKKKSIVAIARRLAVLMYTVLKNKSGYQVRHFKPVEEKRKESVQQLAAQALAAEGKDVA